MANESYQLKAERRQVRGKKVRALRRKGILPGVLYGFNVEPTNVQVDRKEFEAVYKAAGRNSLVDLRIDNSEPVRVFIQDVQRHSVSHVLQHVDFHSVNLREKVHTEVPVVLVGEAPAVHNNIGVLLHGLETITVESLPSDIPHQIEVSVENLASVDDAIHVSDVVATGNYKILNDPTELIVKIGPIQREPEVEAEVEEEAEAEKEEAKVAHIGATEAEIAQS